MRASETKQDEARQKRLRRLAKRHGLRLRKPYPTKDDEGFTIWEIESERRFPDARIRELAARSGLRTWNEVHAASGHRVPTVDLDGTEPRVGTLNAVEKFLTALPAPASIGRRIKDPDGSTVWTMT